MEHRALSIRRPWANLVIAGHKTVENRSWVTSYRGQLLVHAGRTWEPAGATAAAEQGLPDYSARDDCPGGYLGTVRLVDIHLAAGCCAPWGLQTPGTYHWILSDPQPFPDPVPGAGKLGLYRPPADLELDYLVA